jgi:ankyrin repeat protein
MELIKAGADLDITDISGRTPLMIAAGAPRGHDVIVGLLINSGADVNRVDNDGNTALTLAEAAAARDLEDINYDPVNRRYTIMGMLKGIDRYRPDRYGD